MKLDSIDNEVNFSESNKAQNDNSHNNNIKSVEDKKVVNKINEKGKKTLSKNEIKKSVEELNETVKILHEDVRESLKFKLHNESERMMVQVINVENREVIKEIPPEEVLDLIAKIKKMVGVFIDKKI